MTYALPAQIPYQRYQFTGFGAAPAPFNAAATWNDWLAGAPTPTSDGNIAAGMRAADAIRTALTQAGYGPFNMGVSWGTSADKAGMGKFVNDNQIAPSSNGAWWPTKQALLALESAPGVNTAGMSGAKIGLLILGAVALGALAYRAKKKDTRSGGGYGDGTGSGYMLGPGTTRYAANASKKRKRGTRRYKMKGYGVVKAFERQDRQARRRDMKIGVVRSKTRIVRKVDGSTWRVLSKAGYLEDGSAHQIKSPKGHVVVMHDDDIRRDFRRYV